MPKVIFSTVYRARTFTITAPEISFEVNFKSQIALVFATLFTFLKFAGNLVAIRPRFRAYVVSVYSVSSHDCGNRGEGGEGGERIKIEILDHYTFLANCPPTPPQSQHFTPSER